MRIPTFTSLVVLAASCGTSEPVDLETGPDASADVSTAGLEPDGSTGMARIYDADHQVVEVPYVVRAGRRMWQDDIDLGPATLERAVVVSDLGQRWPRTIHWHDGGTAPADRESFIAATKIYEALTPLTFVEDQLDGVAPFVTIRADFTGGHTGFADSGCIGMPALGTCVMQFSPGKLGVHTALHELGHDLGFVHEQSRTDRDAHIDVDTSAACVDQDHVGNFGVTKSAVENLGEYDVHSIMHYPSTGFCVKDASDHCACLPILAKGDWTINHFDVTDNPGFIAKNEGFSGRDIRALNRMYEPAFLGSDETDDRMGQTIALGDLNGDGVEDLAVGATGEAPGTAAAGGAVLLYVGNLDGPTNSRVLSEADFGDTPVLGDKFGAAIAIADVDGDGENDLLVGAPGRGNGIGAVYVYTHDASQGGKLVATQKITEASAGLGKNEQGDAFGSAIAVGDFHSTNTAEVAIGAPGETPPGGANSGFVFVLRWQGAALVASASLGEPGTPAANDGFGATLAAPVLGGKTRLTVGAPGASKVYVYAPDLTVMQTLTGPAGSKLGAAIAVGDFDNEGHRDLAIGAPDANGGAGLVRIYTGSGTGHLTLAATRQETDLPFQTTNAAGDHFGSSLGAGDLDGDGRVDLVVGIPDRIVSGVRAGQFATFASTSTALLQGVWMFSNPGTVSSGDKFGAAVAVGNIDPSGRQSIVIGAPGLKIGAHDNAGAMFYWLGTGTTLPPVHDIIERDQASALGER